jgi:hypothetical protein
LEAKKIALQGERRRRDEEQRKRMELKRKRGLNGVRSRCGWT